MRIALFGKAVSPNDAEALRLAMDRVLTLDPAAWMFKPYMDELSDHMEVPHGLVPFGDVPECGCVAGVWRGWDGFGGNTMVRDSTIPFLGQHGPARF